MSFHLLTYRKSVGASALTQIDCVADSAMPNQSGKYTLPTDYFTLFCSAQGATMTQAVIQSPSLSANWSPNIHPIIGTLSTPSDPNLMLTIDSPLKLPRYEGIAVQVVNGGTAEVDYAAIGATSQFVPASKGEVRCLRATGTTTQTAGAYTQISLTWDATPQDGLYDIVGAECVAATGIYYRLILSGQTDRPGGLCSQSVTNRSSQYFNSRFLLGSYGTFRPQWMPIVEVLSVSADTAQTLFLYVVRKS